MKSAVWQASIQKIADGIRRRVLAHTLAWNGGYLSQACSSAEIFATLYGRILKLQSLDKPIIPERFHETPKTGMPAMTGINYNGGGLPDCDSFILSPAQYALVLYAALIETGRMDETGMAEYNRDGSTVEMIGAEHSPGMEVTTGSLGQGISQAAGIAWARRTKGEPGRVVMLMSDGECQSGEFWEAVQAMSFHRLGNMLIYVDVNGYQCDGPVSSVMNLEPFDKRLKAFGANVHCIDGHNIKKLADLGSKPLGDAPTFVLCRTDPCRGMAILGKRHPKYHYVRFANAAEKAEYQELYDALTR
ncbi:MAG: hypothetical protein FWG73_05815 [Planctomycetaceae bacterium]|nr:hypothetical protein [Planctomycetaceae bacterium]